MSVAPQCYDIVLLDHQCLTFFSKMSDFQIELNISSNIQSRLNYTHIFSFKQYEYIIIEKFSI